MQKKKLSMPPLDPRFAGVERVLGKYACNILSQCHIVVLGLGGVGSWTVEALARSALGNLTLIDGDRVSTSNINRQLVALDSTVSQHKAMVLKARAEDINPYIHCTAITEYLKLENLHEIISADIDAVVDAIDSVSIKAKLIALCRQQKIPLVTTGGAGGLTDPGRIQVADLTKTTNDPLASKVRRTLRRDYGFPKNPKRSFRVPCVYSDQIPVYPGADGTVGTVKPDVSSLSLDCHFGYGSYCPVTATFGLVAAAKIIERLMHQATASVATISVPV